MLLSKRTHTPEQERARHRIFDRIVLPALALLTIFLIYKALTG